MPDASRQDVERFSKVTLATRHHEVDRGPTRPASVASPPLFTAMACEHGDGRSPAGLRVLRVRTWPRWRTRRATPLPKELICERRKVNSGDDGVSVVHGSRRLGLAAKVYAVHDLGLIRVHASVRVADA